MHLKPGTRLTPLPRALLLSALTALTACDLGSDPLLAQASDAQQVRLIQGTSRLALVRSPAGWTTPNLDGAPIQTARVEQLLARLTELEPANPDASCPTPTGSIALTGSLAATIRYVPDRPDCPTVVLRPGEQPTVASPITLPTPEPANWVALDPPQIDPSSVASITLISPSGAQELTPEAPAARALLAPLTRLSLAGLVASDSVNWADARYAQLALNNGLIVEAQLTPTHVRFTAGAPPGAPASLAQRAEEWRDLRRYAFRLPPDSAQR